MLFEPERHQALSSDRWDEQFVRATINRIVADTIRDFSATTLWPTHPDDAPPSTTFYNVYIGAAGVMWALDYLRRSAATDAVPDYGPIIVDLIAPNRASFARHMFLGVGGLLSGDTGILLTAARRNGIPTVVEQIGAAIDGNADNACREFMYGAPGTAAASLALWRETGDAIWVERYRRDIGRLWSQLRPCLDADCLIWEQELGQLASHLGAVHGLPAICCPPFKDGPSCRRRSRGIGAPALSAHCEPLPFAKDGSPIGHSLKEGTGLAGRPCLYNTVTAHQEL